MVQISIIIPVYNVEKYLRYCLESIVSQTFKDFEVLLIDDGSMDLSGSICDEYSLYDPRFITVHKENEGPAVARNIGLKIASGEWITFIDSDDWIEANTLETYVQNICDTDMVVVGFVKESENSKQIVMPSQNEILKASKTNLFLACKNNVGNDYIWHRLYKKRIIIENSLGFENVKIGEDTIFNINYHRYCKSVSFINSKLYHYRQSQTSISKGFQMDRHISVMMQREGLYLLLCSDRIANIDFLKYYNRFICRVCCFSVISNLYKKNNPLNFIEVKNYLKKFIFDNQSIVNTLRENGNTFCENLNQKIQRRLILSKKISLLSMYVKFLQIIKGFKFLNDFS